MTDTTTTSYTRPDGTPYTDHENDVIDRFKAELLDGTVFTRHAHAANANRWTRNYRPMLSRRAWAHYVQTLGRMADRSEWAAALAREIVGVVNLYGTNDDALHQVHAAVAKVMAEPWVDVLAMSGPEAGRRSSHVHEYTLGQRIIVCAWIAEATAQFECSVPGIGWCLDAIARAEHVSITAHEFPSLHRS
jgi:hypothetical protein